MKLRLHIINYLMAQLKYRMLGLIRRKGFAMEVVLSKLILEGRYTEAEEILIRVCADEQRKAIMSMAYDSESIVVYSFLRYMVEKYKTQYWLELIIDVMINPLCFIEGAYSIALFHARELLEMNFCISNLERILFFFNIPEKLVGDIEAELVAKAMIEIEPGNVVALEILKNMT